MAKCNRCGKRGLFLRLNSNGLCRNCENEVEEEKRQIEIRKKLELQRQQKIRKTEEATNELNSIQSHNIILSTEKRKFRLVSELDTIKFSNITVKGQYDDFVVIDTETTGLSASRDKIIDIGAIRFHNNTPVEKFTTLVNPQKHIPDNVSDINGIYDDDVKDAPTISQVLPSFEKFIGKYNIVGHNLMFDLKFIHHAGSNIIDTKRKYFCTLEQSKKMLKAPKRSWDYDTESYEINYDCDYDVDDHKLGTLCEYYNIINPRQHGALPDAYATGKLFLNLIEEKISS